MGKISTKKKISKVKYSDNPQVSVVMPVYNAANYLRVCLDSVINQTMEDIEMICIDDGSTDASWDILNEYANQDERIILQKNPKNIGAARTRNIGLQISGGKYVTFLDSDDIYDSRFIEKMFNAAESHNADMCICSYKHFRGNPENVARDIGAENFCKNFKDGYNIKTLPETIFQSGGLAPQYKLYRRNYLLENDISFQDLKNSNDVFCGMIAMALASKIIRVPEVLVHYREHDNQVTSNRNVYQYEDYKAFKKVYNRLISSNLLDCCYKSYVSRCVGSVLYQWRFVPEKDKESFKAFWRNIGFVNLGLEHCSPNDFLKDEQYEFYKKIMTNFNSIATNSLVSDDFIRNVKSPVMLSVIVPVYNVEAYLEECLDSLLSQKYKDMEIICVDDGSTDGSAEILKKYQKSHPKIKIISKENGGLASARNAGLAKAEGEYVVFVDSDDIWKGDDAAEYIVQTMEEEQLDMLVFGIEPFYENSELERDFAGGREYYRCQGNYGLFDYGYEMLQALKTGNDYVSSACINAIRRAVLIKGNLHFFDGIIHEDELFTFLLMMNAGRCRHVDRIIYLRRYRPSSIVTQKRSIKNLRGYITVLRESLTWLQSHKIPKKAEDIVEKMLYAFERMVVRTYRLLEPDERNQIEADGPSTRYLLDKILQCTQVISSDGNPFAFPYHMVPLGSRVLLYGAGDVGQHMWRQIKKEHMVVPVGMIDKNADNINFPDVYPIADVIRFSFDYIIIAIKDELIAKTAKDTLTHMGVKEDVIKWDGKSYDVDKFNRNIWGGFLDKIDEKIDLTSAFSLEDKCFKRDKEATGKVDINKWNMLLANKTKKYEKEKYRHVDKDYDYLIQRRYIKPYLDQLSNFVTLDEAEYFKWIERLNDESRLDISRLVVVLGTKCSLRCRDCNNLMPLFKPQKDVPIKILMSSLQHLISLADSVVRVELIGGEPFLSSNLGTALEYMIAQPQIKQVELTTNATVMPKKDIVHILQNPKVLVRISDYGKLVNKDNMINFLEKEGIHYDVLELGNWVSSGGTENRNFSVEELTRGYFHCTAGFLCTTLYAGKLYECARSASLHAVGAMKEEEAITISDSTTKKEIKDFLLKPYSLACNHCDMILEKRKVVAPAIQIEN